MAGKGSRQRPTDRKKFEDNWERIFGKASKETGSRESERNEHSESYRTTECETADLEESSLRDAEHSIQHSETSKNN